MPGVILKQTLYVEWPPLVINETSYFSNVPLAFMQPFNRVRRSSGLASDSYGDATFTEVTSQGYFGFVQQMSQRGEYIILAGKEIEYDAVIYTQSTFSIQESDRLVFFSPRNFSTLGPTSQRYVVRAVEMVWAGATLDHKQVYVKTEII